MANDPAGDRVLRAKYLDWCSARVADRFLELTPDQIYDLAYGAAGAVPGVPTPFATPTASPGGAVSQPAAASALAPAALSSPVGTGAEGMGAGAAGGAVYLALVERVAEALAATLRLPPFETWSAAYRESPATFDEELLGLWRGELS